MNYFPLSDVRLLDSDYKHIQDMTHRYLLTLEPDRICAWFRREAGLTSKAKPYPGWESDRGYIIPGHILGFYLSSMAMMYETTGDPAIIKRLEYTLNELDACQNAAGDGFLGATPNLRHVYEQVLTGDYKIYQWAIADVNEPTYIMNKITLGLYDVATKCSLPLAKKVLVRYAEWFGQSIINKLDEESLQKLLICEHGSFSESYVDVYKLTGEKRFLDWAKRLNDQRVLVPLAEGKDMLGGWHANCFIQKNPGFEAVYLYTGEKKYTDAARFFWKTVVANHTWAMGGNSTGEHFFPQSEYDKRVTESNGPEACNSVNMLRLTEALYEDYAEPEMLDYYEKVLVNHLIGAYEPERGMITYYTKLQPGAFKTHSTEHESFWCCTGTGFESPAKFQKMIYTHDAASLYVNLFIPSVVEWKEKGVTLHQDTKIPNEEQTLLKLTLSQPSEFTLKIRHPHWVAPNRVSITVNGKNQNIRSASSQFIELKRHWQTGDEIVVKLPMQLSVTSLSPANKFYSFAYGPVILAAEYDSHDLKKTDYWDATDYWGKRPSLVHALPFEKFKPLTGTPKKVAAQTEKLSADPLTFKVDDYTLIPFNQIHYSRYIVYFPVNNKEEQPHTPLYASAVDTKAKREQWELDRRTVDRVLIGDADSKSETLHKIESISSVTGVAYGQFWRDAPNGGYFMYEMKCLADKPQALYILLNGTDSGARTFDIQIDGKTIATLDHSKPAGKGLYPVSLPIPDELTRGKERITVKFQAKRNNTAGGIFDLRVLKIK
ncbi:hypothetical protein AGMMS49965_21490 [Bacteroidia bacterium]|nr:hypothetical protein AGMMS49965_21490 [Bacteroidia bacterium]